jgi:hypothetical protein
LYYYGIGPFFDYRAGVRARLDDARKKQEKYEQLFHRRDKLQQVWKDLLASGLKTAAPDAESQALHALGDWAQESGLGLSSLKPEHAAQEDKDQLRQLGFHATGTGSWASIIRVLWRLETAPIPLHLNSVQITARKESSDDLAVQLSIATICYDPEAGKPKAAPVARPPSEDTP